MDELFSAALSSTALKVTNNDNAPMDWGKGAAKKNIRTNLP
eukprot:CAMPEP_0197444408 /NCGR_PEP_ID=MMETSP1175-20131217/9904_1 /TAXON_ID=1003142 /ORGANISM="Triceratium dubium, Strain CCMP147" /LENGTH=40 /DNA_ID= /DNA_START= /DNA_END= /DNA_ORIENTATION=